MSDHEKTIDEILDKDNLYGMMDGMKDNNNAWNIRGYMKTILVPSSGAYAARANAKNIMKLAKKFEARIVVVHIRDQGESREGDLALEIFDKIAREEKVEHTLVPAVGEISSTIIGQAKYHGADIIVMGATEGRGVAGWILDRILMNTDVPVLILPWLNREEKDATVC
ncbi:MAG: universal stress protein [Candidatus Thermoplasmatota archaeon]|nr:universal stress protein [Candidatus Thermoplasmatota archaeon]